MLVCWESTPQEVVNHAIANLIEEKDMIHFQEILQRSAALQVNVDDGYEHEYYNIYETHTDVWAHFMNYPTGAIFADNSEKYVAGIVNGVRKCIQEKSTINLVALSGRRGDTESLPHIIGLLYCLGCKNVKVTSLKECGGSVNVVPLPAFYDSRADLSNPDHLLLLIIHSVMESKRSGKLDSVNQIFNMVVETGLTAYLDPGRGLSGHQKALQRASERLAECNMLLHTTKKNRDNYAVTSLGKCYLSIAQQLRDALKPEVSALLADYDNITGSVSDYKHKDRRVMLDDML